MINPLKFLGALIDYAIPIQASAAQRAAMAFGDYGCKVETFHTDDPLWHRDEDGKLLPKEFTDRGGRRVTFIPGTAAAAEAARARFVDDEAESECSEPASVSIWPCANCSKGSKAENAYITEAVPGVYFCSAKCAKESEARMNPLADVPLSADYDDEPEQKVAEPFSRSGCRAPGPFSCLLCGLVCRYPSSSPVAPAAGTQPRGVDTPQSSPGLTDPSLRPGYCQSRRASLEEFHAHVNALTANGHCDTCGDYLDPPPTDLSAPRAVDGEGPEVVCGIQQSPTSGHLSFGGYECSPYLGLINPGLAGELLATKILLEDTQKLLSEFVADFVRLRDENRALRKPK